MILAKGSLRTYCERPEDTCNFPKNKIQSTLDKYNCLGRISLYSVSLILCNELDRPYLDYFRWLSVHKIENKFTLGYSEVLGKCKSYCALVTYLSHFLIR